MNSLDWSTSSWRNFPVSQKVDWPNLNHTAGVMTQLANLPALVFAEETRSLQRHLSQAAVGESFILQCGDCAEDFERCNGPRIHRLLRVILQMATVLSYAGGKKVVGVGRMAGQYAKPRSNTFEIIDGIPIPVYRGDMINGPEATVDARTPNPDRMLQAYFRSVATLNLVRAFTTGGYASLENVLEWHTASTSAIPLSDQYLPLAKEIERAVRFLKAQGSDNGMRDLRESRVYASHEALLLEYEEALTRVDTLTGDWYDTSAHFLWVGERTRQPEGAHVEFLRGVNNPLGIKVGPGFCNDDIARVIDKLNPNNTVGRISLITRFGAPRIGEELPKLTQLVEKEGFNVVWICDPMHGNTVSTNDNRKTRRMTDMLSEIKTFFDVHACGKTHAGGIHLELTGEDVTECLGGSQNIEEETLFENYQTLCDPRLNANQSLELAFEIASILEVKK
jgi:3-deoxy-7-phosphoheptulonate synthase